MEVFLISVLIIGLAFGGIAIKILLKKDGEFSGTCSSQNSLINEDGEVCGICGAMPQEKCKGQN